MNGEEENMEETADDEKGSYREYYMTTITNGGSKNGDCDNEGKVQIKKVQMKKKLHRRLGNQGENGNG